MRTATLALATCILATACAKPDDPARASDRYAAAREAMIEEQIEARGIKDARVLAAMRRIERHRFVPSDLEDRAYDDRPLPIGEDQTISQPYIVALMTELLRLDGDERVLEIGTGSGYQAAVLGELAKEVFTIEIVPELGTRSAKLLESLGYRNVSVRVGDGYRGWPEHAPFDAIIVTAAPDHVPQPLLDQLKEGGRLVLPVGDVYQELKVITKQDGATREETVIPVMFVPMTGESQRR